MVVITKQVVDRLEGHAFGLGVEEVDGWEERRVDDGKDLYISEELAGTLTVYMTHNVELIADVLDTDGRDLYDGIVGDPVARRRDS